MRTVQTMVGCGRTSHMTIEQALWEARTFLTDGEGETPYLDAMLLLGSLLSRSKEQLILHGAQPLDPGVQKDFQRLLERRVQGFPVAYLTGRKEFYGRDFYVGEGVLCPRPDTEVLVEEALALIDRYGFSRILDLCTGSGCVAVTLQEERSSLEVTASDISFEAEKWFRRNNRALSGDRIDFIHSDLLEQIEGAFDCIVSNPPYLTAEETETRSLEISREPALALDGGDDGLDLIRSIARLAPGRLNRPGALLLEAAPWQMEDILRILESSGFSSLEIISDLAGRGRLARGLIF